MAAIEARQLYPDTIAPDAPMPTNEPLSPRGACFIALRDGVAVGCGMLRPLDATTTELRRMYVAPSARRGGVARALLQRLLSTAAELGYECVRLETGVRQQPAIALYLACGFRPSAAFGSYVGDPTSVCFEKALRPD
jgi:GNAT superfamily N-acetyltransferase